MKNLKILALSLLAMNAGLSSASASHAPKTPREGVTLSVSVGVANTLATSFENTTGDYPALAPSPKIGTSDTNLSGNSFAQFNSVNFTPASKYSQLKSGSFDFSVKDGYVNTGTGTAALLPTAPTTITITSDKQVVDLFSQGSVKDNIFYNPFLSYTDNNTLSGGSGLDVTGTIGYSIPLTSVLSIRPMVGFSYLNASSVNSIYSRYNQYSFLTAAGIVNVASAGGSLPTGNTTFYAIEPYTYDQSGYDESIEGAFTMAAQWSFHISAGITFFATDSFSVEGQAGYQMTHFKLSALGLTSSGPGTSVNSVFVPGSENNKQIETATLVTPDSQSGKVAYPDISKNATETFESSLNLSGVRLGISFNFALTNNLSMNLNTYYVKNFKRDFSIDDITIAQIPPAATAAKTDAAANASGSSGANSTTPQTQNTTTPNYTKTSFSGSAAQDITGITMGFTYTIPVGGNNCNPAS